MSFLLKNPAAHLTDESEVGARNELVIEATIGPFFSVSARAFSHSGSAPNLPIFASRSASDSHFRKYVRSWFDSPTRVVQNPAWWIACFSHNGRVIVSNRFKRSGK